ncbi:MAG: bifunctional secretin / adhesin [Halomonas sp. HL-93]|nr:MAG: bifunctional secretin / adhesin [Halomonas sp. HL-93]
MRINQDSDRMAIDWDDFSVDEGSRVAFNQPGRDAAALNRVTGDQLSQIRGAIEANGQVFLVNPNGIVFGDTAQVDVGGLVASTLDISPDDFMAGDFTFEGDSSSAIINQGNIRAGDEGYVALIAAEIINEGNISAPRGDVMMGAGSRVTLDMGGPIKIEVEEALLDTYIEQGGAIQADGGRVYLTAKAAGDLAASVINHTGTTQARTLAENEQGEIWLMGDMDNGETQVAGTLDASAPDGGDGGFVETSAAKVSILDEATVTTRADDGQTGEWLIDPQDYTVAEEDGDITGNTLSNNLADNNVTIESVDGGEDGNGDIFVNDEVTWESGNNLTLDAQRDITINEEVDASEGNGGKLSLEYGQDSTDGGSARFTANAPVNLQAGQNFSTQLGSDGEVLDFTVITELGEETGYDDDTLQAMRDDLEGHYALGADIDASDTANWDGGKGWEPVGTAGNSFRGSFDGLGHEISDLSLNRPTEDRVGLFGRSVRSSGDYVFKNLSLVNVDIIGSSYVGSLVGESRNGIIHNSEATGSVKSEGAISGGLVGSLASDSVLQDSHANVNVSGNDFVGGLVAGNVSGAIVRNSYATGKIEGNEFVGGLAGIVQADGSRIENSFATGDVNGESKVGGLAGRVGFSDPPSQSDVEISNSYATGKVTGNSSVGGLLGDINVQDDSIPKIENNFWDVETSAIGSAGDDNFGATGLTSAEMKQVSTFTDAGWDETVWSFGGTHTAGYGLFRPYLTNVTRPDDIPNQTTLFQDGFGTEDQPFTLTDWQQLQNINYNDDVLTGGYYYALENDLDNNTAGYNELASASANGDEGWKPIGDSSASFTGKFDGQSNTLTELIIDRSNQDGVGLFGNTNSATIQNVGKVGGSVAGRNHVGALVGYNDSSTVSGSYATGNVEGSIENVGGLVGHNYKSTVSNSYATGNVEGSTDRVGGLVGYNDNSSTVSNSYATGSVMGSGSGSDVGGLVGKNSVSTVSTSYNVGGLVGSNEGDVNASFWDTETTGQADSAGGTGLSSTEMQNPSTFTDAGWDETVWSFGAGAESPGYGLSRPYLTDVTRDDDIPDQTPLFDNGFGTEDQPFTLTDWQQLQNINDNDDVLTGGYYYALENDLDANTAGYDDLASASANGDEGWNPIGDGSPPDNGPIFTGQFDGGNNTIGDLTIANDRDNLGLFGATTDASISNLILHNPDVSTTGFSYGVGALAGRIQDTTVDNVTVSGDQAEVKGYFETGGLIGSANESSINNSASAASVTGDPESFNAGGLVGYNDQTQIEDSSASGAVSGGAHVGGLAGLNTSDSLIRNSQSTGDVTIPDSANEGTRGYAGGFVGRNEGSIENASASGDVVGLIGDEFEGTDYLGIGSFAGDNAGLIHNADASGAVTVENATGNETQVAEGLLGRNTGLLANGYVTGSNTAYWRQHDNDMGIADQPDDLTLVDSAAIKARLENGIDVDLATTGDSASVDADIGSQGSVDLGDAEQHDAALSLDALNGISLMSEQALRLGNITAADAIAIATATGDLTLTDDITTEATSDQAVVLTAGDNEAPGTATGGDIRYASGDLTTGTGGGTLLYTGSLAGSEDIATLIAQGDFRYNSSATTANYTEALDAERHLIYREQPEVRVSADGKTITYGDDVPSDYDLQNTRGFVNGDDDSILSGTPTWSVEEALSSAGYQNAGDHRIDYDDGLSNALGYAIVTDTTNTGTLAVDPLTLTAAEIGDGESIYGESLTPGDASLGGALTDDDVASTAELTDATRSRSDNVNVGTYDQQADTGTLTGSDAGNYTLDPFTQPDSYVVTPRSVTVTADDQRKSEGRSDPELTYQAENQQPERGLVDGDTLAGELERETGEDIGRYAIQQGGLDNTQNPNYAIDFIEGELAITTRPVPPTPEPQSELEPNANFDAVVNQTLQAASSSEQEEPMALRNESTNENLLPGGIEIVESGINFALNDDVEGDN